MEELHDLTNIMTGPTPRVCMTGQIWQAFTAQRLDFRIDATDVQVFKMQAANCYTPAELQLPAFPMTVPACRP